MSTLLLVFLGIFQSSLCRVSFVSVGGKCSMHEGVCSKWLQSFKSGQAVPCCIRQQVMSSTSSSLSSSSLLLLVFAIYSKLSQHIHSLSGRSFFFFKTKANPLFFGKMVSHMHAGQEIAEFSLDVYHSGY